MTAQLSRSIPLWAAIHRRVHGVWAVSSGAVGRAIPQDEFVERLRAYQRRAVDCRDRMSALVDHLWRAEGCATSFGKHPLPGHTLNDPALPREACAIAHTGFGAASTEYWGFSAARLRELSDAQSRPGYRPFFIEGVGSILRIYERGMFKTMCRVLGLIRPDAPAGPDPAGFFAGFLGGFCDEEQRLITHGYGRMVAFSHIALAPALKEALALPPNRVHSCVQGVGFAFAMMNSADIPYILGHSAIDGPPGVRESFQRGLICALTFSEWFAPGFLGSLRPRGRLEGRLVDRARTEADRDRRRGHPLSFAVEHHP